MSATFIGLVWLKLITAFFSLVGTSAIAAGVSTVLSSAAAISTIFGVGGAGMFKVLIAGCVVTPQL